MKKRLITLLKMGHTLGLGEGPDRGLFLAQCEQVSKIRAASRATAAVAPPPASLFAPSAQPSLFEAAKAPAAAPPENQADRTDRTDRTNQAAPPPKAGKNERGKSGLDGVSPTAPSLAKAGFLQPAKSKLKVFLAAAAAFVPKSVARLRGRLVHPARRRASARPGGAGLGESESDEKRFERMPIWWWWRCKRSRRNSCAARAEGARAGRPIPGRAWRRAGSN